MKVVVGRTAMRLNEAIPEWEERFPGYEFVECNDRDSLAKVIGDADVIIGGVNRDLFLQAKQLKWIQASSTGINNFMDIPEFVASDCLLTNVRGTHGGPLSESVFAMIFAFNREIRSFIEEQKKHNWTMMTYRPRMRELRGATMGILGFGGVGKTLARRAAAFDMELLVVDKYPGEKPEHVAELWGLEGLNEMLARSDYVVITAPYTQEAHHMIDREELALIKPDAMIVIISRGGIVSEKALLEVLQEKRIRAAAIDVWEADRLAPESPFWDLENCLVTPHAAGGSNLERDTILEIVEENLGRFIKGDLPLRNQIDKQLGF